MQITILTNDLHECLILSSVEKKKKKKEKKKCFKISSAEILPRVLSVERVRRQSQSLLECLQNRNTNVFEKKKKKKKKKKHGPLFQRNDNRTLNLESIFLRKI